MFLFFARYTRSTRMWVWLSGGLNNSPAVCNIRGIARSTSSPGSRAYPTTVVDSNGNLLIMSGLMTFGTCGDIFSFSTTTLQWRWLAGVNFVNNAGDYSNGKGVPFNGLSVGGGHRYGAVG